MMLIQGERVDHEGVPEQVHVLAGMAHAVGSPEVEAVLQPPVDGLGIAAPPIQTFEVGITRRDRTDVLCPIELATFVYPIGLESHHDCPAAVRIGQCALVVPAVEAGLVLEAQSPDPAELDELVAANTV